MKRSILFALIAALALAAAFGPTAAATPGGGDRAIAAKKKGKGKGCKKKGKGKGKKSRAASASKKKGKGKRKGKGCKKGKGKPKATPQPGGPGTPAPTPPGSSWPPADGRYADTASGETVLIVKNGGKEASVAVGGSGTCIPVPFEAPAKPAQTTPTTFTAGGEESIFGGIGEMKWSIAVTTDLQYTLTLDSTLALPEQSACEKPGVVAKGTLVKQS